MQATLTVPRIHCGGCVSTVERTVQKLRGVTSVQASEVTKEVKVDYDPARVDEQKIRGALALVGYPAA